MAYKQYRHKLNLHGPGTKMFCLIILLLTATGLAYLLKITQLVIILGIIGGGLTVTFFTLLVIEQHEDKVLNEQAIRLDQKLEAGIKKKSFALNYNGGMIWCEHLDSLGDYKAMILSKFKSSIPEVSRPSSPSFIIVNLDESMVDEEVIEYILHTYRDMEKSIKKVAFVGLNRFYKHMVKEILRKEANGIHFIVACIDDFEKAKEWAIGMNRC